MVAAGGSAGNALGTLLRSGRVQEALAGVLSHTPAGVVKYNPTLCVSHGEGSWVYTTDGKKVLDMAAGIGATSTGHCHPRVVEAVRAQVGRVVHAQQSIFGAHEPMVDLYDRLRGVLPQHLDHYLLANSGAEAVENAIKVARAATGRQNIIAFDGGFHGRTNGTMALTSSKTIYRQRFGPLMPGVAISSYPYCLHCKAQEAIHHKGYPAVGTQGEIKCCNGPLESLENLLHCQSDPADTAAVIIEPVLGEGGFVVPPPGFLQGLRKLCTKHGILLIMDEVQAGAGRSGKWWGHSHWLASRSKEDGPDILTFAKGIASGYPLAGVAMRRDLMSADKMPPGSLGGTYGGNAVACAAAVATIDVINEEGLCANATERGKQLSAGLAQLSREVPGITDVRGPGLMIGVELGGDGKQRNAPAPHGVASALTKACAARGMLLLSAGAREAVRFLPPLNVSATEVDAALQIFGEAAREVLPKAFFRESAYKGGRPGEAFFESVKL